MKAAEYYKSHTGFFDIAANLSDDRFKGKYHHKQSHEADFDQVIARANEFGVKKFLFAAGYIQDAVESYSLALRDENFYATVGIHPCRALEPFLAIGKRAAIEHASPEVKQKCLDDYIAKIDDLLSNQEKPKFVAVGECGLDYDRLEYASKEE